MKLNKVIYNKLLLQAEEAREQGMIKLANVILNSIGSYPSDEPEKYSYLQLQEEIHNDMWKVATKLISYYDIKSSDVSKLDETLSSWASQLIDDLEITLNVDKVVKGPNEPLLPGEDK
jgi:hypothetical protein